MVGMSLTLIVVVVPWIYAYVQTYQIVYNIYVQFLYITYTSIKRRKIKGNKKQSKKKINPGWKGKKLTQFLFVDNIYV